MDARNDKDRRGHPAHVCPYRNSRCGVWKMLQRPSERWHCSRVCELLIACRVRSLTGEELRELAGGDERRSQRLHELLVAAHARPLAESEYQELGALVSEHLFEIVVWIDDEALAGHDGEQKAPPNDPAEWDARDLELAFDNELALSGESSLYYQHRVEDAPE